MKFAIGLDPGAKGAAALIAEDRSTIVLERFENRTKAEINFILKEWLCWGPLAGSLELVGNRPGEGGSSIFKFGRSFGLLEGILLAQEIPFDYVTPQVWQRMMALGRRYPTKSARKEAHKLKAKKLFPTIKGITQETGDALLIAEYAWRRRYFKC